MYALAWPFFLFSRKWAGGYYLIMIYDALSCNYYFPIICLGLVLFAGADFKEKKEKENKGRRALTNESIQQ